MNGEKPAYSSFNYKGGAAYNNGNEKPSQAARFDGLNDEFQRQIPAPEGMDWFCPMCNNVNEARAAVCTKCGSPHRLDNGLQKQSNAGKVVNTLQADPRAGREKEFCICVWQVCCSMQVAVVMSTMLAQDDEVRKWVKEDSKTKEGLWAACCCTVCLPW